MKRRLWCLCALLLALPAAAGELFEHPQTPAQAETLLRAAMPQLGQVQLLRGQYRQRKFLSEIPRPLASAGEFLLLRDRGIWWHTQTPLDAELTLTRGTAVARQPGADVAAAMFFALFALDLDTLARSFDLFAMPSAKGWLLGLRPRDAALAAWFKQATLAGSARVEQVILFEANGDRTEIDLDAVVQPLSSLTSAERQRFER